MNRTWYTVLLQPTSPNLLFCSWTWLAEGFYILEFISFIDGINRPKLFTEKSNYPGAIHLKWFFWCPQSSRISFWAISGNVCDHCGGGNSLILVITKIDPSLQMPTYFSLRNFSLLKIGYVSVTILRLLADLYRQNGIISFLACAIQMCVFLVLGVTKCFILTAMA